MKMKKRSHRYDVNGPKPRYSKYKKCLNMILLICFKVARVVNLKLVLTD